MKSQSPEDVDIRGGRVVRLRELSAFNGTIDSLSTTDLIAETVNADSVNATSGVMTGVDVTGKVNGEWHVSTYGAKGDNSTDDTAAIQACVKAMMETLGANVSTSAVMVFDPLKVYRVFESVASDLCSFKATNGLRIKGNGATIYSAAINPAFVNVFKLDSCLNVTIEDLYFVGGNTTLTAATGERFVYVIGANRNIAVRNCILYNCRAGMEFGAAGASRTVGVIFENIRTTMVYYPLQPYTCDDLLASMTTVSAGRSYFPTSPCSHHDVRINSTQGGPYSDVLIKVYAGSATSVLDNTISDINVTYSSPGRASGSGNVTTGDACVMLEIAQADAATAAGHFRNINIDMTVDCTTDKFYDLFSLRKFKFDGTYDNTTTRGHTIRGVHLKINALNTNNLLATGARLFSKEVSTNTMNWTGDTAQDITVEGLVHGATTTDSVYVNGEAAVADTQTFELKNIQADGTLTTANMTNASIAIRGCKFSNANYIDHITKTYTPTWGSSGVAPALGNGNINGRVRKDGDMVEVSIVLAPGGTSTFGTGNYTLSVPYTSANDGFTALGSCLALETGVNWHGGPASIAPNSTSVQCWPDMPAGGQWGAAAPWAFKNGDSMNATIRYRST